MDSRWQHPVTKVVGRSLYAVVWLFHLQIDLIRKVLISLWFFDHNPNCERSEFTTGKKSYTVLVYTLYIVIIINFVFLIYKYLFV